MKNLQIKKVVFKPKGTDSKYNESSAQGSNNMIKRIKWKLQANHELWETVTLTGCPTSIDRCKTKYIWICKYQNHCCFKMNARREWKIDCGLWQNQKNKRLIVSKETFSTTIFDWTRAVIRFDLEVGIWKKQESMGLW